jgi:hypothetical protein
MQLELTIYLKKLLIILGRCRILLLLLLLLRLLLIYDLRKYLKHKRKIPLNCCIKKVALFESHLILDSAVQVKSLV